MNIVDRLLLHGRHRWLRPMKMGVRCHIIAQADSDSPQWRRSVRRIGCVMAACRHAGRLRDPRGTIDRQTAKTQLVRQRSFGIAEGRPLGTGLTVCPDLTKLYAAEPTAACCFQNKRMHSHAAAVTCRPRLKIIILTLFHNYLNIYSRFFSNFHLIVIQSLNPWDSQLLVSWVMSPIYLKFLRHSKRVNLTHWRERDWRDATLYCPDASILRLLGCACAATMRARCCCFVLCEDGGVQCMLFQRYLKLIAEVWSGEYLFREKIRCISIKTPLTEWQKVPW